LITRAKDSSWIGRAKGCSFTTPTLTEALLFVGVMGFSTKTYAEAFASEQLEHWIAGHCHAFSSYGGVTHAGAGALDRPTASNAKSVAT